MDTNYRPFIAELIGTFAVVFVCGGAVCAAHLRLYVPLDVTGIVLAQGLIVAVALTATVNVSGGYLNPGVTVCLWVLRRLEGRLVIWLLAAQVLGALVAGLLLRMIFEPTVFAVAVPHLGEALPRTEDNYTGRLGTGAGVELVLTFLLMFVIFGAAIDRRTPKLGGFGIGLIVGLTLIALALVGKDLTGASLNPARAVGPWLWWLTTDSQALGEKVKEQILVYWIAPVVGALLAGWLYTFLILPADQRPPAVAKK
jgi:MIP family channel proteins